MKGKEIINDIIRAEMPDMEEVREKCVRQTGERPANRRNAWAKRMVPAIACAAVIMAAISMSGENGWLVTPSFPGNMTSTVQPTKTESDNGQNTQTPPPVPSNSSNDGAVYHDVEISELIRSAAPGKVPASFWFSNRLMAFAKNETGINRNNGVRWDKQANFTKEDMETALHITVTNPVLPSGDYTTEQSVLVDEATGKIIAYQTVYYFFDKDTMELQHSFRIFYLSTNNFVQDSFEQSDNIVLRKGAVHINEFVPVPRADAKIPHVRHLVYLNNSIAIVIEGETDAILTGDMVDQEKSLEKYEQLDKELISMMESLIKG